MKNYNFGLKFALIICKFILNNTEQIEYSVKKKKFNEYLNIGYSVYCGTNIGKKNNDLSEGKQQIIWIPPKSRIRIYSLFALWLVLEMVYVCCRKNKMRLRGSTTGPRVRRAETATGWSKTVRIWLDLYKSYMFHCIHVHTFLATIFSNLLRVPTN